MNDLKTIRIFLATIFLVAALAWLFLGPAVNPMAEISFRTQIIPSALGMTIGATAFWLVATFVFGRLYCSTVCPVGSLQDLAIWFRRFFKTPRFSGFHYRHPLSLRWEILIGYAVCLLLGFVVVGFVIEPWNIMRNVAAAARPQAVASSWTALGINAGVGIACGFIVLLSILLWAFFCGRMFCTSVCPIGTALGAVSEISVFHIEFDPDKCISCMKCEEVCPSSCIKVVGRLIDNSRCVRCFNCLKVCPNDAIRYQRNRNRRMTPMMQRRQFES